VRREPRGRSGISPLRIGLEDDFRIARACGCARESYRGERELDEPAPWVEIYRTGAAG
jgi:hypothetical protein